MANGVAATIGGNKYIVPYGLRPQDIILLGGKHFRIKSFSGLQGTPNFRIIISDKPVSEELLDSKAEYPVAQPA